MLAMAPFFLWPVLFVTLPVLVWLLDGTGERASSPGVRWWRRYPTIQAAAGIGWWFGFGYFLLGTFWIGEAFLVEAEIFAWLLPFAVTLLPAGLALFPAAALGAARAAWRPGFTRVLVLALALSLAEWLRGHILTGFPWNVLGYALTSPLALMQAAGLVGIYGLTLSTVVILPARWSLSQIRATVRRGGPAQSFLPCCWQFWRPMALQSFWPSLPATCLASRSASYSPACRSARNGARRTSAKFSTTISTCHAAMPRARSTTSPASRTSSGPKPPCRSCRSPPGGACKPSANSCRQKTQLITGALRVEQSRRHLRGIASRTPHLQ